MAPRANSKLLAKLRERALSSVKKAATGRKEPQTIDVRNAPAVVQHAVVRPINKPPPPRAFQAKSRTTPLGTIFTGRGLQSARVALRTPLVPARQPTRLERRRAQAAGRPKASKYMRRWIDEWLRYGTIDDLRSLLRPAEPSRRRPGVLIAIDTESERHGLVGHVVEVGITCLRLEDIRGTEPGEYLRNWNAKMQHRHLVIDNTRYPRGRMRTALFGTSMFVSVYEARTTLLAILRACARGEEIPNAPVRYLDEQEDSGEGISHSQLYLLGQSIDGDLTVLKGAPLELDVRTLKGEHGVDFGLTFDTFLLSEHACNLGADIPSRKLGNVAKTLGIDPDYHDPNPLTSSVKGTHNAVNDAAYTMMVALMYAAQWGSIIGAKEVRWRFKSSDMTGKVLRTPSGLKVGPGEAETSGESSKAHSGSKYSDVSRKTRRLDDEPKHLRRALIFLVAGTALVEALSMLSR